MKQKKVTALSVATAVLTHPEVQKLVKSLAESGFEKAKLWWAGRASHKISKPIPNAGVTSKKAARKKGKRRPSVKKK